MTAIRCRIGDQVWTGRTISLDATVDPAVLTRAVRSGSPVGAKPVRVACPEPGPVYEHVGCIRPEMGVRARTALAKAGRSRGLSTPVDEQIRTIEAELVDLAPETVELAQHRRELAATESEIDRLQERVAAARGRLRAHRENDLATEPAREAVLEAIRQLTEAETAAAAARQQLADRRERARSARDRRDRRLTLEDRLANNRREARKHLVTRLSGEYEAAVVSLRDTQVSGTGTDTAADADPDTGTLEAPFDVDGPTAALAVARVATVEAPIVLATDRFRSAAAASRWLDAPVIQV